MQKKSESQSALVAHDDRQAPLAPQANGPQGRVAPAWQVLTPSQRRVPLSVPPLQVDGMQMVPDRYLRQAPLPSQVPSVPQVAAVLSAHWPSGSWPAGTVAQVPAVPGCAHERQVPSQAVPQQVPCSQKPELHWSAVAQVLPSGFLPQLPLTQVLGDAQSPSVLHVVRQVLAAPSQVNGMHDCVAVGTQAPLPSQREARFMLDPLQVGGRQVTPDGYLRQAPAPSQTPSVPQLASPWSGHLSRGSVPISAGMQWPTLPLTPHDRQGPVHASLQQTPSTQKALRQSSLPLHDRPSVLR